MSFGKAAESNLLGLAPPNRRRFAALTRCKTVTPELVDMFLLFASCADRFRYRTVQISGCFWI
jgi:hypothetical protein